MFTKTRAKALLQQVDLLIEKYQDKNPDLIRDLQAHREALRLAASRGNAIEAAAAMLRISSWVKFFYDHWPGD